jgi:hypothetical protein
MELSFTELDEDNENFTTYYDDLIRDNQTINTQDTSNHIVNTPNMANNVYIPNKVYLQKQNFNMIQKVQNPKRKTISYDDILSSMNTVVIDGKLEFIRKNNLQQQQQQQIVEPHQQQQHQQKKVAFNHEYQQINKNSYIYNKFFKDYKEPTTVQNEQPMRPLTKNELIKQLIINRVNAFNERNRIAQIKSTKLLFNNNNNVNIIINSMQNPNHNGLNHMFNFKS